MSVHLNELNKLIFLSFYQNFSSFEKIRTFKRLNIEIKCEFDAEFRNQNLKTSE